MDEKDNKQRRMDDRTRLRELLRLQREGLLEMSLVAMAVRFCSQKKQNQWAKNGEASSKTTKMNVNTLKNKLRHGVEEARAGSRNGGPGLKQPTTHTICPALAGRQF